VKESDRRPDAKGHLERDGRNRCRSLSTKSASPVYEHPHLLVTRPVEPHPAGRATDTAVHLGDRNCSARLSLDLVEKASWNARREGEHAATIAW
jgi:hypothetical protein